MKGNEICEKSMREKWMNILVGTTEGQKLLEKFWTGFICSG
jgi:hypothetical protein